MFKDYYKILGVNQQASASDIKSAYRAMSMKWHPDKNPDADATSIMQDINEAYAILKDENKRKRYDDEYNQFTKQHHQTSSNINTDTSDNSQKYEYDYDVQDETLREDIKTARAHAQKLVDEFIKSFKTASKNAAKGAWEGAKSYIFVAIFIIIIGIIIKMCNSASYHEDQTYFDPYTTTYNHITKHTEKEVQISKVLSTFKIPDNWTQYVINHNAFILSVPSTVELRHEYDQYTQLLQKIDRICNSDVVVFQQKGLSNATSDDADKHYCRIMIQHVTGNAGDFLKSNETEKMDIETKTFLRELATSASKPFHLLKEPSYDWIDINGQKAIEIKYRRNGNNGNTTACTMYLLFNYDEMVKMIVSYREQEKNLWLPDLDNIIKTFKWQ